ncbi:MAG: penicillin-binding transpeptidase domain-containing protein [Defluviitaleaceae bacterium]|nr:penicillin-binding transpeptidase domain-containing protein [Defluviitaleaceae bacterium]
MSPARRTAKSEGGRRGGVRQITPQARPVNALKRFRVILFGAAVTVCFAVLLGRVGIIKYVNGSEYEREAVKKQNLNRESVERESNPNRGYIFDRNHQPLAVSSRVYTVALDVTISNSRKTDSNPERDAKTRTLAAINEVLGIPISELEKYYEKGPDGSLLHPTNFQILARKVQVSDYVRLKEKNVRDIVFREDSQRRYIDPFFAPQTLGFQRGDTFWGLESYYDAELTGERGRTYRAYDPSNNPIVDEIPSRNGYSLITTLDSGIQNIAQRIAEEYYKKFECEYSIILVMQPYTGEILAMAQCSSFSLADPDDWSLYNDKRLNNIWDALSAEEQLNRKYLQWRNYSVINTFEPGSIFKPIVVAAALEENIINPATFNAYCGAKITVADHEIPCWSRYGHGGQDIVQVLANSCNVAMIEINKLVGRDIFFKYRNDFGYGERTGIDLPGEASVSSPAVMYPLSQLNPVELATSSMGQGFNNTAIQAITAFAAVINGGNLMKPYVVSQIVDERGNIVKENAPEIVRKVISAQTSDFLREAMQSVVSPLGTGRNAIIEGYTIGGKTGSGQQGRNREGMTVAFAAYTPVENPEYIVLAILDNIADTQLLSSVTVAPMVRELLWQIIQYKNMRPSDGSSMQHALQENDDRTVLADYSGMGLAEVIKMLNNLGIDYQTVGQGTVVARTTPAAGRIAPKDVPLFIYLDPASVYEDDMAFVPNVTGMTEAQGIEMIKQANLVPIVFIDKPDGSGAGLQEGGPTTYYPAFANDENDPADIYDDGLYTIYQQYPAADSHIQKWSQVKIKVR